MILLGFLGIGSTAMAENMENSAKICVARKGIIEETEILATADCKGLGKNDRDVAMMMLAIRKKELERAVRNNKNKAVMDCDDIDLNEYVCKNNMTTCMSKDIQGATYSYFWVKNRKAVCKERLHGNISDYVGETREINNNFVIIEE